MTAQAEICRKQRMILGITGGIGCGKSTATAAFAGKGFHRLDSDALIREKVLTSSAVQAALQERYGSEAVNTQGTVNRGLIASRVFADDTERLWLEELTHPPLFSLWRTAFASEPDANWAVEVPLLFEKRLEIWFDFTVCVASAPAHQLARLEQRGLSRALAEQRISKQLPLAHKIDLADFVLWNDGTRVFLEDQIGHLIETLTVTR